MEIKILIQNIKGDVENGKPNGFGFLIFTNGDKYVGEWKNGKKQGQGTFHLWKREMGRRKI